MAAPNQHREVERKLRVHPGFTFPDLVTEAVIARWEPMDPFEMTAVYYDTAALSLFRWKITMRRRTGGSDEGWHLKLPVVKADSSTRDELQLPLSAGAPGSVPASLADIVSPLVREESLRPVVTVKTLRTPYRVFDADDVELVEIVDDHVSVFDLDGKQTTVFREIEVETKDAANEVALTLMDAIAEAFVSAGAVPGSVSKAASALGPAATAPPDISPLRMTTRDGVAVDALRAMIGEHARHLLFADVGVRRDQPDSVHQMRVAARRLRSMLRTFGTLFEPTSAEALRVELAWMASELGLIRDTEVMLKRLINDAKTLDPNSKLIKEAITPWLEDRLSGARSSALAALRSDRHVYLLEDLVRAANDPLVANEAFLPCEEILPPLVAREWKALRKAVEGLTLETASVVWHRARIKAKHARYAVEAMAPIFGTEVENFANELAKVTEVLGDHQDTYVAWHLTIELSDHVDGPTGFMLGRLHDYELAQEMLYRHDFLALWPSITKAAKRSGLV